MSNEKKESSRTPERGDGPVTHVELPKEEAFALMLDELELDRIEEETSQMSDEEIYADLEKQGLPRERVNALFAKQDETIREAPASPPKSSEEANVIPFRTKAKFMFAGMGIAATFALAIGATLVGAGTLAYNPSSAPSDIPTTAPAPAGPSPSALRDEAFSQCGKTHWERCRELLDVAKERDIQGDGDPQVQATRNFVSQMLAKDGG